MMKTLAGLWIYHPEAVSVLVSETRQETRRIKSQVATRSQWEELRAKLKFD
jgi:hypothetical protein